jgi:CDP-paratose synthetase
MNILLTGATGFLGSNLLAALIEDGHNVTILIRQTTVLYRISNLLERITIHTIGENNVLENLFRTNTIDTIIHCATNYGRGQVDSTELLNANLILPLQLLKLGSREGVRCFINTDTILDKRVSDYALSKSQFQEWLVRHSENMVCINVALEHFYGPLDNPTKFVSFIVKQLLDNVKSIDLTKGEQKRDFIYIADVVSAFQAILRNSEILQNGYYSFEIGSGRCISIRNFVELAKQISGNSKTCLNFGAVPYRENEAMETTVNLSKISALGWTPHFSLEEGLAKMIKIEEEIRI